MNCFLVTTSLLVDEKSDDDKKNFPRCSQPKNMHSRVIEEVLDDQKISELQEKVSGKIQPNIKPQY